LDNLKRELTTIKHFVDVSTKRNRMLNSVHNDGLGLLPEYEGDGMRKSRIRGKKGLVTFHHPEFSY
jgi:hypothetical protein